MDKIIPILILLTFCLPIYSEESISDSSKDTFLDEQINGYNSIIHDYMNPRDSMYLVSWIKSYDLHGKPIERSAINFQIVVFSKKGQRFRILNISEAEQYGIDSIYCRELNRISKLLAKLDVAQLIKDRKPCINNELEFAEVLGLVFMYGIVPKTAEEATVKNDSINGK